MNAINMARSAYATAAAPIKTSRSAEYEVIARITHRLQAAHDQGRDGFSALATALFENRRLWTSLAADVAEADNPLPEALRARIFYLMEFTNQHSRKVLAGDAEVGVLIDINTAIMRGLRSEAIPK